jgi:hypothetical protein
MRQSQKISCDIAKILYDKSITKEATMLNENAMITVRYVENNIEKFETFHESAQMSRFVRVLLLLDRVTLVESLDQWSGFHVVHKQVGRK